MAEIRNMREVNKKSESNGYEDREDEGWDLGMKVIHV